MRKKPASATVKTGIATVVKAKQELAEHVPADPEDTRPQDGPSRVRNRQGMWFTLARKAARMRRSATNRPKNTTLPPWRRKRYWPTLTRSTVDLPRFGGEVSTSFKSCDGNPSCSVQFLCSCPPRSPFLHPGPHV